MAKKSTRRRRSRSIKSSSLVDLARRFEAVSKEVQAARAVLASKEEQLAGVRQALGAATGGMLAPLAKADDRKAAMPRGRRASSRGRSAGGRPRAGTLVDFITKALSDGQEWGRGEVLASVTKAGYTSKADAKTQAVMVSQALSRLVKEGAVRKLGRGRYMKA